MLLSAGIYVQAVSRVDVEGGWNETEPRGERDCGETGLQRGTGGDDKENGD